MKKALYLTMAMLILLTGLTGCSTGAASNGSATYKDGTYRAEFSDFDSHGWKAFVEVTVKDDKFTEVVIDYLDADGNKKSADEEYKTTWQSVNPDMYPEKAYNELRDQLLDKQDITKIDGVSGATSTTDNFKTLVGALESNMKSGNTDTVIVDLPKESE